MKLLLSCGDCGADMTAPGCKTCRNKTVQGAVGIQPKGNPIPWAIAAGLLCAALLVTLDTGDAVQSRTIVVSGGDAAGVRVVVHPGQAVQASFNTTGNITAPTPPPGPPQGMQWDVVLPPVALLAGLSGRAAYLVLAPGRLQVAVLDVPILHPRPQAADAATQAWLDGLARRLNPPMDPWIQHISQRLHVPDPWLEGVAAQMQTVPACGVECVRLCVVDVGCDAWIAELAAAWRST